MKGKTLTVVWYRISDKQNRMEIWGPSQIISDIFQLLVQSIQGPE